MTSIPTIASKLTKAREYAGYMRGWASIFRAFPNDKMWGRPDQAEHAAKQAEETRELLLFLAETLALLNPFVEAADDLDDRTRDDSNIWELPAAMSITAGDLRRLRTHLQKEASK